MAVHREHHEQVGGLAGLGAGMLAGAAAGSAVMPVVGTFTGALLGGLVGSELGKIVGGAILDVFTPPPSPSRPQGEHRVGMDIIAQLERLSQMRADGLITEEEFRAAKARLLGI